MNAPQKGERRGDWGAVSKIRWADECPSARWVVGETYSVSYSPVDPIYSSKLERNSCRSLPLFGIPTSL
jgi:hypothetical protein